MTDKIAVIIPAYGHPKHLRAVLEGVLAGDEVPHTIYVSHSGSDDPSEWLAADFPQVQSLHSSGRLFAGAARNQAARISDADILAFCDDDTVPQKGWLSGIRKHFSANDGFLVGSVGVERTGGYWGMALWLCEFSEQAPWRPLGEQTGGASCNFSVRREDLASVDYFPENFRAAQDTMLFLKLRTAGFRQIFDPSVEVRHFNIPGFAHFKKHLSNQGRHFAKARIAKTMPGSAAIRFWPLAPFLGVFKGWLILKRMINAGRIGDIVIRLPGIIVGISVWAIGCTFAAATGKFTGKY